VIADCIAVCCVLGQADEFPAAAVSVEMKVSVGNVNMAGNETCPGCRAGLIE
jgi:hypothetical protein